MELDYCLDCKKYTDTVIDSKSCDRICSECGLVLENCNISESAEWRTFSDDNNDKDPTRVGSVQNPLLTHGNLETLISKSKKGDSAGEVFHMLNLKNPDTVLLRGFEIIASMAGRLGLVTKIKNRANEIYKNVEKHKSCRGRKLDAIFAASLFIACRESKLSRTLKEFSTVANGVKCKEINKAVELIKKQLEVPVAAAKAGEFVRRFGSNLGMDNHGMRAVQEAVTKSEEFDIRRSPKSVLAAILYMITQLSDQKKSLQDISRAAEVAEFTIKKSYKDLYPYATKLIPLWYAKEEEIKKLCSI
ncbi:Transcription initiation factor IIB [Melia azedarach]|uniref:Transcription initiation factor IIB n=1 Tax=Melia azedarach TaxID=155640 RepID=A0ACC1X862_MELAZ|nr:Transcription initiation factor IIB [Melia azedarach]